MEVDVDLVRTFKEAFVNKCHKLLINGYYQILSDGMCLTELEEEDISARLIGCMEKLPEANISKIDIVPEARYYTEEIKNGKFHAKQASKPDIRLCCWKKARGWSSPKKILYYIEAKNISEKDWIKSDGSSVSAYHYRRRYIDTGIDNYISGHYPEGCIVGYIVNGVPDNIVSGINNLLCRENSDRVTEVIRDKHTFEAYPYCYISYHKNSLKKDIAIKHFLLVFSKNDIKN